MNKINIILALLIATTITCYGQTKYPLSNISSGTASKSCHRSVENKDIGLCNIKTDTINLDQLKGCKVLTINENGKQLITSFKLGYFLPDTTAFVERYVSGNQIPKDFVDAIIKSGAKKIVFSEILGVDGTVNLDLGYRWFYFK